MSKFWEEKIDKMKGTISAESASSELETLFDKYDWFYSSVVEENSICVYVNVLNEQVFSIVPDIVYGYQVKIGFASYLNCGDKYGKEPSTQWNLSEYMSNDFD